MLWKEVWANCTVSLTWMHIQIHIISIYVIDHPFASMQIEDGCPVGEACIWPALCCSKEGSRGWFRCPCQSGVSLGAGFLWMKLSIQQLAAQVQHSLACWGSNTAGRTPCLFSFDSLLLPLWSQKCVAYGCCLATWISFFLTKFPARAAQEASYALETHLTYFPEDSGAVPWSNELQICQMKSIFIHIRAHPNIIDWMWISGK